MPSVPAIPGVAAVGAGRAAGTCTEAPIPPYAGAVVWTGGDAGTGLAAMPEGGTIPGVLCRERLFAGTAPPDIPPGVVPMLAGMVMVLGRAVVG